jgi:uncharacterized protein YceH (UPF0502 family)
MDIVLSPVEVRVLGSLVEKELTTPEYYPLSLNSLVAACNQKSNRDPVMELTEDEVGQALDSLRGKNLAWQLNTAGGRVPKFEHNLPARLKTLAAAAQNTSGQNQGGDTAAGADPETADAKAVENTLMRRELSMLTVLMLRGPLTVGEIRTCTGRMHSFKDLPEVEETLQRLCGWEGGPLTVKLARETGRKEHRYAHLFCGATASSAPGVQEAAEAPRLPVSDRVAILEQKVALLTEEIVALKQAQSGAKKP